jgi:hypothetical protein
VDRFRPEEVLRSTPVASELAGLSEVADLLKVTKRSALRYSKRADFPVPVERLASGPVWRLNEVREWARKQLPLPAGRPPHREGEKHEDAKRST